MQYTHVHARHRGLTTLEALGIMACISCGLILGLWLMGEDLTRVFPFLPKILQRPAAQTAPTAGVENVNVINAEPDSQAASQRPHDHAHAPVATPVKAAAVDEASHENDATPTAPAADAVPVDAAPPVPAGVDAIPPDVDPANVSNAPITKAEVQALLGDFKPTANVTKAQKNNSAFVSNATPPSHDTTNLGIVGERTLVYWNSLNDIMLREETMRTAPAGGVTQVNAADFIARRGQAGNYASTAIRALDARGVDTAAVQLGSDIAAWYENGAKLNARADYLLNQADAASRRGQAGQSWGNSEKAHNASVAAINRRGDTLRRLFTSKYGLAFPDLR